MPPVGGGGHVHDLGEGSGEGGMLMVADAFCNLADPHGGVEEAVAGGGDLGVHDEALGGGAEVGAETPLEGAYGHRCFFGKLLDRDGIVDVVMHVVDQAGNGPVGRGEGVAFSLV